MAPPNPKPAKQQRIERYGTVQELQEWLALHEDEGWWVTHIEPLTYATSATHLCVVMEREVSDVG